MVTAQATDYLPRKLNPPRVKRGQTSASQAAEKWSEKELIEVFDSRRAGFLELILEYMNTNQNNNRQRYFYEGDWYTVGHSMGEWHEIRASTAGPIRTMQRYIPELRELGFIKTHSFYRDWQNGVGSEFRNKKFSYSVNVDLVRKTLAKQNGVRIKWKRLLAQHRVESSMYAQTEPTYEPEAADAATFSPQIPHTFLPPRSTQSGGVYLCILNQKQLKNKHVDSKAEIGEPIKLALLSREGQLQTLSSRFCQSSLASLAPVGRINLFNSTPTSKALAGVEVELVGEANGISGQLQLLTAFELQGHSAAGKSQNHSDVVSLKNTAGASGGTNTILELAPPRRAAAEPNGEAVKVDIGQILAGLSVPDSSHAARRLVAARLESCGFSCQQQYPVASNGYYGQTGRVDIVARRGDLSVAIEIDRRSTRKKSALKLMSSDWIKVSLLRGFANKPFPPYLDFGLILPIGGPAMPLDSRTPARRRAEMSADVSRDRSGSSFPPSGGFRAQAKPATPRKNDYSASRPSKSDLIAEAIAIAENLSDPTTLDEALEFISGKTLKSIAHDGQLAKWRRADPSVWKPGLVGFRAKFDKDTDADIHPDTAAINLIKAAIKLGRQRNSAERLLAPRTFHPSRVVLEMFGEDKQYEYDGRTGHRAIVKYADDQHLIQTTIVFLEDGGISLLDPIDSLEIIPGANGQLFPLLQEGETDLAFTDQTFPHLKGSK